MSPRDLKTAIKDPEFVKGNHVILVTRARDIPGFSTQLTGESAYLLQEKSFPEKLPEALRRRHHRPLIRHADLGGETFSCLNEHIQSDTHTPLARYVNPAA